MHLLVTKVVIIIQGSDDPNSPWVQAQFNWFKKLAIQFGKLNPTNFLDPHLVQMVSGGHPETNKGLRYGVEKKFE